MMPPNQRRAHRSGRIAPRIIVGLTIAVVGIIFALNNLGVVRAGDLIEWWPVALIAIGVANIADRHHRLSGAVFLFFGSVLLARNLGWTAFGIRDFGALLPLLLVFVGWILIRQALDPRDTTTEGGNAVGINMIAIMGGNGGRVSSSRFVGGDMTALMGGCVIDLRKASLDQGEAIIDAVAVWGGIEILVPQEWRVESRVVPLLGGFDDRTRPPESPTGTLVVRGTAVMGGIEVKN